MSLNGLDDPRIKEAHDAAIAEPGGWFLLKYATRDEVDILDRGSGGILEIRKAIAAYEEPSPLFGFLKYRRRNVVIKYVPEGVSRLVQARVTVHFNAVTDTLSPHDTVFSIETAKQLKDSALSAACSLHTASGSTSSSTSSLRQRRLLEIEEEEEEDNRRHSTVLEEYASTIGPPSVHESVDEDRHADASVADSPHDSTLSASDSHDTERDPEGLSLAPTISITSVDSDASRPSISTVQERPSFHDGRSGLNRYNSVNSYTSYSSSGRQKVKLGPRPSLDTHTPSTASVGSSRPVSSLPAGLKLISRKSQRPKERLVAQALTASNRLHLTPNMDSNTNRVLQNAIEQPLPPSRPTTSDSSRSFLSMNTITAPADTTTTITPQKAKLLKALEERKKKMAEKEANELSALTEATAAMEAQAENGASSQTAPASLSIAVSDDVSNSSSPASPLEASIAQEESTRASSISEAADDSTPEKIAPSTEGNDCIQSTDATPADASTISATEVVATESTAEAVTGAADQTKEATSEDTPATQGLTAKSSNPELKINGDEVADNDKIADEAVSNEQNKEHVKEMVIPQSKFSTQNDNEKPDSADGATVQSRKSLVAPITIDTKKTRPTSEIDLANDDGLMDELQSATVQEAKPMQLPKSPGKAMFSRDIKRNTMVTDRFTRAVSSPNVADNYEQRPTSSRSVSASQYLNRIGQQQSSAPMAKKVNVGGGIAERIKALEKLKTSSAGTPTLQTPSLASSASPSPTFFAVRRTIPSKAPSIADRADSLNRRPGSQASTRGSSPEQQFKGRGRTLSITNRNDQYSLSPTGYTGRASIQIARDSSRPTLARTSTNIDFSEHNTLDAHQSRVSMDQQRAIAAEVMRSTSPEKSDKHGRQSSITTVKDLITGRRQSVTQDNQSVMSNETSPEKKQSRASRMLQKMSSTLSSSRKNTNTMSPPLAEEAEPASDAKPTVAPVTTLEMGDVNVQFPDNLLWKRRAMHLDSQGFLILTQSQTKGSDANAGVKKYHLTEFKRPQVPDIDMEEMPNSVVLSFVEGSGLQFACSDRQGQMWCLQRLQEAHAHWIAAKQ